MDPQIAKNQLQKILASKKHDLNAQRLVIGRVIKKTSIALNFVGGFEPHSKDRSWYSKDLYKLMEDGRTYLNEIVPLLEDFHKEDKLIVKDINVIHHYAKQSGNKDELTHFLNRINYSEKQWFHQEVHFEKMLKKLLKNFKKVEKEIHKYGVPDHIVMEVKALVKKTWDELRHLLTLFEQVQISLNWFVNQEKKFNK